MSSTPRSTAVPDPEAPVSDYVIVGGGTAGSVIASRLTEDPGTTVTVIEGGPTDIDRDDVLTLRRWLGLLGGDLDYDYPTTEQPRGNSHIRHSRARVLGGCSSHNTLISFKPLPGDWDEWARERRGLGRRRDGPVLRQAAQQHRPGRREGPQRHRPRLRGRRPAGRRGPARGELQPRAVPRGRRLLRPRLPPREQQALLRLGGLPPPAHRGRRPPQPPYPAGDVGVPAGVRRHPRHRRPRPHEGRRGAPAARRPRGHRLRGRGGHASAAAALRDRPARGPGGAGHRRPPRPSGRRREPARPPRVRHRLGDRRTHPGELRDGLRRGTLRPPRPRIPGPGPDVPLLPDPVHRQPRAPRLREARARGVDDAEHPQAPQPRPPLPHQRRPRGQTRPGLPVLHRRGRLRRPHPGRRHQARPRDRRHRTAGPLAGARGLPGTGDHLGRGDQRVRPQGRPHRVPPG